MAHGSKFVRATVHGILLNTMQSIASLPQVMADGELVWREEEERGGKREETLALYILLVLLYSL